MNLNSVLKQLRKLRVIPVVRTSTPELAETAIDWLTDAGFRTIEITLTIGTKNRTTKYVGFLNRKVSYTKIKKELLTSTEQTINRKKIEKEEKSLSSRGN